MNEKSRYHDPLVQAIAGGLSIRSAAVQVGCSESTAYRLARTPEFISDVSALRTEATDLAVGRLSNLAIDAVNVLGEVMADVEAKPGERIAAAKAVLTMLIPITELNELRHRMDALEQGRCSEAA